MSDELILPSSFETDLTIGPSAIDAYSRLSYTMWYGPCRVRRQFHPITDQLRKLDRRRSQGRGQDPGGINCP